jgi:hypothetical protein
MPQAAQARLPANRPAAAHTNADSFPSVHGLDALRPRLIFQRRGA